MSLSHFIPTLEVIAAIGVALRWSPAVKCHMCHAVWDVGAPLTAFTTSCTQSRGDDGNMPQKAFKQAHCRRGNEKY